VGLGTIVCSPSSLQYYCCLQQKALHRKRLLLSFAFIGSVSAMGFFIVPSSSPIWPLSALFAIVSNVCFGVTVVAMNAYLPFLARSSKEVVVARKKLEGLSQESSGRLNDIDDPDNVASDSEDIQLLRDETPELSSARREYYTMISNATAQISSKGIASGYLAGVTLLLIALVPFSKLHGSTFSLQLAIGLSGVWWALFSLPAAAWLPTATNAALMNNSPTFEKWTVGGQILAAWKRLGRMLRWTEMKKLRNTFRFLAAWFFLSDGQFNIHL
jgi:MFS transporter, UMF1 family